MKRLPFLLLYLLLVFLMACQQDETPSPITEPQPRSDESQRSEISVEVIASGFSIPWGIEIISENEFLFTERLGKLYHYKNGDVQPLSGIPGTRTITFAGLVYGGLMDVSLHPQFESNHLVYIAYVALDHQMAVARFNFENETVSDFEVIFESNAFSIGSRIVWQNDTHFFLSQGVGGSPLPEPGPQDLRNDAGKIHRLLADGQIPEDNPVFAGFSRPTSVWSYGHRDPQGLYYEPTSATLFANEHGPWGGDELNIITKGGNYGWPLFSYGLNYNGSVVSNRTEEEAEAFSVLPIAHWDHEINIAPSGLLKLSDSNFSEWNGLFLMGSLAKQRVIGYNRGTDETSILLSNMGRVRDIAQLPSGDLLVLIDAGSPRPPDQGRIVKLSPK